jgi:hypothetical protein
MSTLIPSFIFKLINEKRGAGLFMRLKINDKEIEEQDRKSDWLLDKFNHMSKVEGGKSKANKSKSFANT